MATSPQLPEAFRQGLRDLGYVEGRNVVIEYRDAGGNFERLPALAAELVALKVDVILAGGTPHALAAKHATRTIPIVFAGATGPVENGLVTSLARPGGNVTGLSVLPQEELVGKRLELIKQAVPGISQVAILMDPGAYGEGTDREIRRGAGVAAQNEPGLRKKERDGRAPAGIFEIGQVFGYESNLPAGADYPYHQVTEADVWSDDPRSPNYNRHIVIDPKKPPDNYTHEKMRSGDFAYHWLIEIRHNSDPPVPGAGSAIFFHIRRGVNRPTTGCTTMAKEDLVKLIMWLRARRHPCYALLPAIEYDKKWRPWNLPSPEKLGRSGDSTVIH